MITRNNALTAATLVAGITLAGSAVVANPATATATQQPPTASQSEPSTSWIGRQAVSSDGRVLGTVTKIVAGNTPEKELLVVRSAFDSQKFAIPAGIAKLHGNVVRLAASAADLQVRNL